MALVAKRVPQQVPSHRPKYPWREKYQQAWFRGASFHVETDMRASGRRVALHQYPKRNTPYAEDMGRQAIQFKVQGYLIGPNYLDDKDILIGCLEADGPGLLQLPMPYQGGTIMVMVQSYAVTEARERGGYCVVDMGFIEYGDPVWRATVSTAAEIQKSATNVESAVTGPDQPTTQTAQEAAPYANTYMSTDISNFVPSFEE
jgi:prophage DNA circulation protein